MSIRIHQLAKEIGMENKELVELLQQRGYEVKSVSSTIDNISAESLREEFTKTEEKEPAVTSESPSEPKKPAVGIPPGAIVRSKEDIDREREEREAAKKAEAEAKRNAAAGLTPTPPAPAPKTPPAPEGPGSAAPPRVAPGKAVPPRAPAGTSSSPAAPKTSPATAAPSGVKAAPSTGDAPKTTAPPMARPAAGAPAAKTPPPGMAGRPPVASAPKAMVPPGAATPPSGDAPSETAGEDEGEKKMRQVTMKPPVVLRDLADVLGVKSFRLIAEFMEMGIFASMNGAVEEDVAKRIAANHGVQLEIRHRGEFVQEAKKKEDVPDEDDEKFLKPRPPVVCILGHVDHGKTTLMDAVRKANVADGEAGGITQHIGAYRVKHADHVMSFIDTPGHAAFSAMREMGANVTDIAILVVAADDGFMPQTDEALKFARKAQNAVVVAVNKMDSKGANLDRVKTQMQEHGIAPEDWGGETLCVPISALNGDGVEELLDNINLQSEIMELRANPDAKAAGIVIESQVEQGRGASATIIVEKGTLKPGAAIVCGECYCRVRAMLDEHGKQVKTATPATAVKIIGWSDAPDVGGRFETVKNEREAKKIVEERIHEAKMAASQQSTQGIAGGATIDDLFAAIENQQKKVYSVILKSDVSGSLAAIKQSLEEINSDKVELKVISGSVGPITKADVTLATTAGSAILGFNVRIENGVQGLAKHHGIDIYQHSIIYELLDMVTEAMADLLDPELREKKVGSAEIRQVFSIGRGQVAGCMVIDGGISRNAKARLMRKGEMVGEAKIDTLRRFKDDVSEVRAGYECGIHLQDINSYEEGDIIECFEVEKIRASL